MAMTDLIIAIAFSGIMAIFTIYDQVLNIYRKKPLFYHGEKPKSLWDMAFNRIPLYGEVFIKFWIILVAIMVYNSEGTIFDEIYYWIINLF